MNYENYTIAQAKYVLKNKLREGFTCPCCDQFAKMYSRPISSSMAAGLCIIYNESKDEYIHIETLFKGKDVPSSLRGDIPKLRFWNLIMPKEGATEDGNPNSGYYKITLLGQHFVENRIKVPSHVDIYNNTFYGYSPKAKDIGIVEALKEKFNYNEIVHEKVV